MTRLQILTLPRGKTEGSTYLGETVLNPTYPLNELDQLGLGIVIRTCSSGEEIFIPISQIALIRVVEEQ
jgi:hypothetical protein